MHKPCIIFFDIDGTLIDMEKKRITERTLDALRRLQQNGILLAVATGRSPLIVPRFDGVEFDVFLTYNGSYCYDRRGDIFASPIPPQDVQTLIQNAAALGRPVSVAGRTQLLSNGTDDDLTAYYAIGGRAPVISDKFDDVSRGEVFQLLMGCRESDWPAILKGTSGAKIAAWWDRAVDIIPISGGKGAGIQKVLAYYGLTPEDAMAFGDGNNDIEMFQAVGHHGQRLCRFESHRQRGLRHLCRGWYLPLLQRKWFDLRKQKEAAVFNLSVTASPCHLPLSRGGFGMAESPISSPEAPLGRGAVERSETERLLLQRPLIFAIYFSSRSAFSASCCRRSFLMRFFSLSTRGQGHEKPSFSLHQRVSG